MVIIELGSLQFVDSREGYWLPGNVNGPMQLYYACNYALSIVTSSA